VVHERGDPQEVVTTGCCRGFATAARRAGAALERIGLHGGWADGSKALLGYLEEGDRWTDNPVTGL
jgi:hypothetical protein